MSEVHNFESFTPAERSYFDSRGEKSPLEAETPTVETEDTEAETEEIEAAEPEAEEETTAKDETAKEDDKSRKPVSYRALKEERDKRKALEKELATQREWQTRADERLKLLQARFEQPEITPKIAPQQEITPPNPQDDPIGAIEYIRQQQERLAQEQAQRDQAYRQQQEISAIDTAYKQSWGSFAANTPDALNAYQHFVNVTAQFLEMQGVPADKVNLLVENEERKITVAAMQRGMNPAELIYESAKRMGYQPKAVEQTENVAAKKAEADIERRQKAAPAAKSLSSTGGTRGGTELTIEELARMPEDEFDAYMSKLTPAKRRRILGD